MAGQIFGLKNVETELYHRDSTRTTKAAQQALKKLLYELGRIPSPPRSSWHGSSLRPSHDHCVNSSWEKWQLTLPTLRCKSWEAEKLRVLIPACATWKKLLRFPAAWVCQAVEAPAPGSTAGRDGGTSLTLAAANM